MVLKEETNAFNLNRRNFLKTSAAIAVGYCVSALPFGASAATKNSTESKSLPDINNFTLKTTSVKNLPLPHQAAEDSAMVKASYAGILASVEKIKTVYLRDQVRKLIKDPLPTVAENYTTSSSVRNLYATLAARGYIKTDELPENKLIPPYEGRAPQPFHTAPGSGYHSHHAYPGGLATHVNANMGITEGILKTYGEVFAYDAESDYAIAGQALHDICKPWVFQWLADGSSLKEYTIGGTGSHHIFSIAEVMYRNFPPEEVVAQACAHNHPGTPQTELEVVTWLKAAAIIAGKDPIKYGVLTADGTSIPTPHKQAGFIVHLGDHDWVLSVPASQQTESLLQKIALEEYNISAADTPVILNNFRNYIGAQISSMRLYYMAAETNGYENIRTLVKSIIRK